MSCDFDFMLFMHIACTDRDGSHFPGARTQFLLTELQITTWRCKIWGSHDGESVDVSLQDCNSGYPQDRWVCLSETLVSTNPNGVTTHQQVPTACIIRAASRRDDGSNKHLRNVGRFLADYTVRHPTRQRSSYSLPRKHKMSRSFYHLSNYLLLKQDPLSCVSLGIKITTNWVLFVCGWKSSNLLLQNGISLWYLHEIFVLIEKADDWRFVARRKTKATKLRCCENTSVEPLQTKRHSVVIPVRHTLTVRSCDSLKLYLAHRYPLLAWSSSYP